MKLNDSSKLPSNINAADLVRFTEAQQMKLIEGDSCLWVEKRPFFLESMPQHRRIRVANAEAMRLYLRGAMVVRYTCEEAQGAASFEYVWDDKGFDLESLHKDAKRNVRKNIDSVLVRSVPYDILRSEGLAINLSVLQRQGRSVQRSFLTDAELWGQYLDVCEVSPFVEAFGAFIDGKLCAFSLVLQMDRYCYTYQPFALVDSLKKYSMNVLIYSLVKTLLARPGVDCVSYGLESFAPHPSLERFKLAMGCRKRPIGRRVLINPLLRPALTNHGSRIAGGILDRFRPGLKEEFMKLSHSFRAEARA
jgi:hypothetical protein